MQMSHHNIFVLIIITLLGLITVACTKETKTTAQNETPVIKSKPPVSRTLVTTLLGQISKEATEAQEQLAMVQSARSAPTPTPLNESDLPPELQRNMTLNWVGPAEQILTKLAKIIDYRLLIVGNPPVITPVIHLNFTNIAVVKIIEQVGLQSYPVAEVTLDPNIKRIEYRYLPSSENPFLQLLTE